jgi:hypothetical protein
MLLGIVQNDEAAVLQGEKEAEKMIVEAYSALLLAFLSTERFAVLHSFVLAHAFWSDVSQIVLVQ